MTKVGREASMTRSILLTTVSIALTVAFAARAQEVLPRPEPPFKGHIGRTVEESTKDFPREVKAPKGAPNVLLILTDDVGFGASSTFGGPVPTRRHQPVGPGHFREHQADRAAARQQELFLRKGHGRQGHRTDSPAPFDCAGQTM